jgi:hypothetical protein
MKAEKSGVGLLNDIERWRTRAKETRMVAETMHDGVARDALLQVANDWEQMAQLAEESEENIAAEAGVKLIPGALSGGDRNATANACFVAFTTN